MFRKIFLLSILTFSFSYAVDEIDIEKRRQEQQDFDTLIKSQDFSVPENNKGNEQKNLILNVNSIKLEGNTIFEDFQIDALLKRYVGKDRDIYALINELENKYIERGYVTTKVGLNTEKSDFDNGNISLFIYMLLYSFLSLALISIFELSPRLSIPWSKSLIFKILFSLWGKVMKVLNLFSLSS